MFSVLAVALVFHYICGVFMRPHRLWTVCREALCGDVSGYDPVCADINFRTCRHASEWTVYPRCQPECVIVKRIKCFYSRTKIQVLWYIVNHY